MVKFLVDNKNILSSILAFLIFIYEPVRWYLTNEPFDWMTFILMLWGAIVSYTIGKYPGNLVSGEVKGKNAVAIEQDGWATSEELKATPVDPYNQIPPQQ